MLTVSFMTRSALGFKGSNSNLKDGDQRWIFEGSEMDERLEEPTALSGPSAGGCVSWGPAVFAFEDVDWAVIDHPLLPKTSVLTLPSFLACNCTCPVTTVAS
jgi:hypothetical protein